MEPIEIKASDLIKRPGEGTPGATSPGGGFNVKSVREMLNVAKEIKAMAKELGIDLDGLGSKFLKRQGQEDEESQEPKALAKQQSPNTAQQIQTVIQALILNYGDLPVEELFDRLKTDYGSKKLSSFLKGKK